MERHEAAPKEEDQEGRETLLCGLRRTDTRPTSSPNHTLQPSSSKSVTIRDATVYLAVLAWLFLSPLSWFRELQGGFESEYWSDQLIVPFPLVGLSSLASDGQEVQGTLLRLHC